MTHPTQAAPADHAPGYKVDISRGQRIGRASSEWFSRPDDERFLSLDELYAAVRRRAEAASTRTVETKAIRVVAAADEPDRLSLLLPDREAPVASTHWSFGQLRAALIRLAEGEPITNIALDLSFGSASNFIRMFRQATGFTPGRYFQTEPGSKRS